MHQGDILAFCLVSLQPTKQKGVSCGVVTRYKQSRTADDATAASPSGSCLDPTAAAANKCTAGTLHSQQAGKVSSRTKWLAATSSRSSISPHAPRLNRQCPCPLQTSASSSTQVRPVSHPASLYCCIAAAASRQSVSCGSCWCCSYALCTLLQASPTTRQLRAFTMCCT